MTSGALFHSSNFTTMYPLRPLATKKVLEFPLNAECLMRLC